LGGAYERFVTGSAINYCKWSNKEYDRLWSEQGREFDAEKRWKIIKQMQTILLNELPFIPFGDGARWAASHAWVHNWHNFGASWAFSWYPGAELIWVEPP
jgi:ABC-type transport system substrate-binding protein